MSKKQVFLMSLITALPAAFLLFVLVMAAINHGGGVFAGMKWLFWGLAAVGGAIAGVAPILIMLLYPAQGFAPALAVAAPVGPMSVSDAVVGGDDEFDDDDDMDDSAEDDGEQLFDENAIGDEYDDEMDVAFGDDEDEKY